MYKKKKHQKKGSRSFPDERLYQSHDLRPFRATAGIGAFVQEVPDGSVNHWLLHMQQRIEGMSDRSNRPS